MTSSRTINDKSWYSWKQMQRRLLFAYSLLQRRILGPGPVCPYCHSMQCRHLGSKFFFLAAKQCDFCGLIFRWPVEDPDKTSRFYEKIFSDMFEETTGTKSEIASGEMDRFIAAHFKGGKYDYHPKLDVVKNLLGSSTGRFLDFGAGWGYIAFQAQEMGWTVEAFEISLECITFARDRLGITVHDNPTFLTDPANFKQYDVIFMHHVLEHLQHPREILDTLYQLLVPGGRIVIVVPNPASDRWNHNAAQTLGQNHISAFTKVWFQSNLPGHGLIVERVLSAPYVFDDAQDGFFDTVGLRGFEIMAIAHRPDTERTISHSVESS